MCVCVCCAKRETFLTWFDLNVLIAFSECRALTWTMDLQLCASDSKKCTCCWLKAVPPATFASTQSRHFTNWYVLSASEQFFSTSGEAVQQSQLLLWLRKGNCQHWGGCSCKRHVTYCPVWQTTFSGADLSCCENKAQLYSSSANTWKMWNQGAQTMWFNRRRCHSVRQGLLSACNQHNKMVI